jgi:hypothetical protein
MSIYLIYIYVQRDGEIERSRERVTTNNWAGPVVLASLSHRHSPIRASQCKHINGSWGVGAGGTMEKSIGVIFLFPPTPGRSVQVFPVIATAVQSDGTSSRDLAEIFRALSLSPKPKCFLWRADGLQLVTSSP